MKKEMLKRTVTDRKSPFFGKTLGMEKETFLEVIKREDIKNHEKKNNATIW